MSEIEDMEALSEQIRTKLLPKMANSAVVISLLPEAVSKIDAKLIIEIGACVLLDKPLILIVPHGVTLPARLRRVSDHVLRYDPDDPAAMDGIAASIGEMLT